MVSGVVFRTIEVTLLPVFYHPSLHLRRTWLPALYSCLQYKSTIRAPQGLKVGGCAVLCCAVLCCAVADAAVASSETPAI
jgi:hypothetical protein